MLWRQFKSSPSKVRWNVAVIFPPSGPDVWECRPVMLWLGVAHSPGELTAQARQGHMAPCDPWRPPRHMLSLPSTPSFPLLWRSQPWRKLWGTLHTPQEQRQACAWYTADSQPVPQMKTKVVLPCRHRAGETTVSQTQCLHKLQCPYRFPTMLWGTREVTYVEPPAHRG